MRLKIGILSALILLCLALIWWDNRRQTKPLTNLTPQREAQKSITPLPAPTFAFTTLDDTTFTSLHQMQEPLVFINFWASWCAPCVAELPDMIAMIKAFNGRAALLTISVDDSAQNVQTFIKNTLRLNTLPPHTYWVWDHNKTIANLFQSVKVPETIVLNANRDMVAKIVGAQKWQKEDWAYIVSAR